MSKKTFDKKHKEAMERIEHLMFINQYATNAELIRFRKSIALIRKIEIIEKVKIHPDIKV